MRKSKKILSQLLLVVMAASAVLPAAACSTSSSNKVSKDVKTLNVRISKVGYGTEYITKLKEQFEKTFEEEGYKINVMPADPELSATKMVNQIKDNNGIDVYFGGSYVKDMATSINGQIMEGSAVLDITESVMNAKPIKFDGTEEDCTVLSKIPDTDVETKYDGKYWCIPYVQGVAGLAVNTKVLQKYSLSIPKTSNEMFAAADKIMETAMDTLVFPYTYSLSGNNYPITFLNAWMMQYLGLEKYETFLSMQNADGTNLEKPYEIWGTGADGTEGEYAKAIVESLTAYYQLADPYVGSSGSRTQDFVEAQADLMEGEAAFFAVGDWMFNEEYVRYNNKLKNITFVNTPVLSALGVKLFGAGTSYNKSEADCDVLLSAVVGLVDENKTVEEIQAAVKTAHGVDLLEADVNAICEARGAVADRSESQIWISKNTTKADVATTFLRFCASTDAGTLIAQSTRTNNPFAPEALANTEYDWFAGVNKIINNRYAKKVRSTRASGLRHQMSLDNFSVTTGTFVFARLSEEMTTGTFKTIYDGKTYAVIGNKSLYRELAVEKQKTIYKDGKKRVEELMAALGS